jgi:hypothetical protein
MTIRGEKHKCDTVLYRNKKNANTANTNHCNAAVHLENIRYSVSVL